MSEIIKNPNEISDSELDNVSGGTDGNANIYIPDTPDKLKIDGNIFPERPNGSTTYHQGISE